MLYSHSRYPSAGGAFKVQIYSPYVLFNKTGLDFALKSKSPLSSPKNVAGLDVFSPGSHRSGTSPYLFNHGSRDARNRVLLRIADSSWSEVGCCEMHTSFHTADVASLQSSLYLSRLLERM